MKLSLTTGHLVPRLVSRRLSTTTPCTTAQLRLIIDRSSVPSSRHLLVKTAHQRCQEIKQIKRMSASDDAYDREYDGSFCFVFLLLLALFRESLILLLCAKRTLQEVNNLQPRRPRVKGDHRLKWKIN